MATTQLSDIYEPLTFEEGVAERADELNVFSRSGVMVESEEMSNLATIGGSIGELPFAKPLDASGEPDYTNDDPDDTSTPAKVSQGKMIWRLAAMHKSWSTMDFARQLGFIDPLGAIINGVAQYWATIKQRRVIYSALGILADNDANDSDDMMINIYSDIASPASTNIISAEAILDTVQTAGDAQGMFTAIAMHSITYNTLNKANLIDFIPDSTSLVKFAYYLGYAVVVDDGMPVIAGSNSPKYTSILFGAGAFDHGKGVILKASELEREASAGNGGGQDILHSRQSDIIHPYGFQFTSSSVADETATLAELATAANWDRVVSRKNVPMAFLIHNN